MRYLGVAAALAIGAFVTTGSARAQHHHGGHHGHHHGHVAPIHHGIYYGHHNWHHVVPHHPRHIGAYYTVGTTHYYTPSPVTPIVPVVVSPGQPAPPPPAVVEVQKPIELAFGGFRHREDLAGRLSMAANMLCLELHYNYRHNKDFAEVYGETYGILQTAKYLHGREHQGDRAAIAKSVAEVDRLFHHVQDEMRGWTRAATKQIGTDTLPDKIASMEALLHHLCFDVGVRPHEQRAEPIPPPGDPNEVAPPPIKKQ